MKKSLITISLLAALAFSQGTPTPQSGSTTIISKAVYWGGLTDSTQTILLVGGAVKRDSAGTYVASDSCSKWVPMEKGGVRADAWNNLQLSARGVSSPPSVTWRVDSRYCLDPNSSFTCQVVVPSGRHFIHSTKRETDTLVVASAPTTAGGYAFSYYVTHGNQQRFCIDKTVSAAGDSLYVTSVVIRGM